jgi:hypothetical protein
MLAQMIECSGVGGAAASAGSSSGGGGLGGLDWPVVLAFMAGAAVLALLSAGLTLIAARRLAPVAPPIPTWGQPGPV